MSSKKVAVNKTDNIDFTDVIIPIVIVDNKENKDYKRNNSIIYNSDQQIIATKLPVIQLAYRVDYPYNIQITPELKKLTLSISSKLVGNNITAYDFIVVSIAVSRKYNSHSNNDRPSNVLILMPLIYRILLLNNREISLSIDKILDLATVDLIQALILSGDNPDLISKANWKMVNKSCSCFPCLK